MKAHLLFVPSEPAQVSFDRAGETCGASALAGSTAPTVSATRHTEFDGLFPSDASDLVMAGDHPPHEAGGPCATCAFRAGSEANRTEHTVMLARLCVEGFRPFHCHEHPHACRGWIAAINLRGAPETEEERRWSIVAGDAADVLGVCIDRAKAEDR